MIDNLPLFVKEQSERLTKVGIDQGTFEIVMILTYLLKIDRLRLYLDGRAMIDQQVIDDFEQVMRRRLKREPLQYILGESWFYGRRFTVTPVVMVPTPETEMLCETALGFIRKNKIKNPKIVDIGVGSGVIAITMAAELPEARLLALDLSGDAIEIAKKNAVANEVEKRIEFRQSDSLTAVTADEKFDLILSNPPYIKESDYDTLLPEVKADPKLAMTSGEEGLDIIKKIIKYAPDYLAPCGRLMFEIGYDQSEKVIKLTEQDNRYTSFLLVKDLNDIDRVVVLGCD
jgi:release factor glutamine methyltransferase